MQPDFLLAVKVRGGGDGDLDGTDLCRPGDDEVQEVVRPDRRGKLEFDVVGRAVGQVAMGEAQGVDRVDAQVVLQEGVAHLGQDGAREVALHEIEIGRGRNVRPGAEVGQVSRYAVGEPVDVTGQRQRPLHRPVDDPIGRDVRVDPSLARLQRLHLLEVVEGGNGAGGQRQLLRVDPVQRRLDGRAHRRPLQYLHDFGLVSRWHTVCIDDPGADAPAVGARLVDTELPSPSAAALRRGRPPR